MPSEDPFPASFLEECEKPAILKEGATMGDLIAASIHLAEDYRDCSNKHQVLINVIKTREKIKWGSN